MVAPHKTEQKGNSGTQLHGGRPPEAHEEEVRKAEKCYGTGESNRQSEREGEKESHEMKEADE
jgi:hypothetical protein